jgi:uncharacterized protein with ParB-like and HNH nuclease domain
MKVEQLKITALFNKKVQFVIPIYQRNYDWKIAQCKELLNDICDAEKNKINHFVGSIVYIHDDIYSVEDIDELVIIDGQQRLTTINILYVALYRFAKENNMQEKNEIYNVFLTNQYAKDESYKLKLKQTDFNAKAFQAIIDEKEGQLEKYSNVKENFCYFKEIITQDNFSKILEGLKRLVFVAIGLERGKDDPQRIFESLNSTGIDLSQSDLIRNFVLMDLKAEDQNRIYKNIWEIIEENAQYKSGAESKVSDFMRDYITLKTKNIANKNKIYYEFKKRYSKKDKEDFELELENIKKFSYHYNKFINPETVSDQEIKKELCYISRLEINVVFPFLLQIFEDFENKIIDKTTLIKILKLIQSLVWRRFIVDAPTNALGKIFMTLYGKINHDNYLKSLEDALLSNKGISRFPMDAEVRSELLTKDLYNITKKNKDYLFELLENYNNREIVVTTDSLITVEHIFPRNPHKDWKNNLSTDEYRDFIENKLNTIANLTLSGNNSALGNLPFIAKRDKNEDNKEQGYKYSRLWLNDYLKKQDRWNIKKYHERFEIIYERFLKIWPIPELNNESLLELDYENLECNIFDAEEPKNKKLEYFIFEDRKIDENNFTKMYVYVLKELYRKNPELFLSNKKVKVSSEEDDFRSPKEVENGYYVETNNDSNGKFLLLKEMLKIFSLEDWLIVKYKFDSIRE